MMTRIFNRLRVRLTIIFVALTVLPLLIAGALIALQAFNSLNDQAIDLQDQVVHRVANDLTAFIDKHENELLVLTEVYDFSFLSEDEQNALLAALVSRREAYYSLTLVDGDGQEIMRSVTGTAVTNNTLVDRTGDPAFENPRETRAVYLGTVRFNEEARERLIPLAIPIEDLYTGDIGQVLIAELRFKAIGDSVLRGLDLAEQGEDVYVLDADGIVVAHREPDRIYKETVFTLPEEDGEATGLSGDDVILVSYSVQAGDLELTVVSEKDYGDATALASDLIDIAVLITLITLAVAGAVVTWIVGQVVNPIARLSRVAQAIQQGDLSAQADVRGRGELAELGRAFNDMTSQLQASIIEEQNRQAYLENTVSDHLDFVSLVAAGDLTNRLDLQEDVPVDDLYQLGGNLNVMVESLNQMAQQVRNASGSILAATSEIQAAATQQSASATEQAAIVTQTVATVEEIRTTVLQTAERAQIVADMAQQTVDVSLAGESAVTDTMTGMELLRERVEGIAENILLLSERTQQIGEIIEVVNTIAEQSKLLALNASIEAARAGEEGKGFAVVAMEVRQLAEQSREATARVGSILTEIQQATNNAVMVTEEGSKGAESSMELVDRAGEAIRELASSIAEAAQAATQIAASTHQQTNGMDQLAAAMGQIKQATSQTVDGMQQTERSVRDLMDMAHQLEQATDRYQLTVDGDGYGPELELGMELGPDPETDPETQIM